MNELRLKRALEERAQAIQPSVDLFDRVKWEAYRCKKEKNRMKLITRKAMIIAAILCLICTGCFAASQIGKTIKSGSSTEIVRYADLEAAAKEIGINGKYVEAFENGYRFASGGVGNNLMQDENGAPVGEEAMSLIIDYRNDAGSFIMLNIEKSAFYAESGIDVGFGYCSDAYKFVPTDYEITAEEKVMMEKGELNISYGSEEVEINQVENYIWQDGELIYGLTALDANLGEAEMTHMARQIMG